MAISKPIRDYLDSQRVPFETIHHRRDYTAQETAADTHTKGQDFAKTVILWADNQYYMVVVPATRRIDFDKVKQALKAEKVALASEEEITSICPDCEVGAMPPLGPLFNLPVLISHHLTYDHMITFNGGTHEDVIRMTYRDFDELVKPKVLDLTMEPD
ncbi:MAG: deacylase [Calditrichaeota bacterium]|nr:MAG: deacylase [Calditrichota bacterium]